MRRCLLILLLSMVFVSCEKQLPTPPTPAPLPWSGKLSLSVEPPQPPVNKETTFRVKLLDEAGKPVTDASVKASLKMTTMDMGKNEVDLVAKGGGEYVGTGKFTMSGPWTVEVNASVSGKSGRQSFPLVVR